MSSFAAESATCLDPLRNYVINILRCYGNYSLHLKHTCMTFIYIGNEKEHVFAQSRFSFFFKQ